MNAAIQDIATVVRDWLPEDKKLALAILIGEAFSETGEKLFVVRDENDRSLAIIQPLRLRVKECTLDENTPYMKEMRRRVETWEDSIPLDELLEQIEKEEQESVFSPNLNRTPLSDDSGRWFDKHSARKWAEALISKPDGSAVSRATGIPWKHETLFLSRCGTFIMNFDDEHDYPTDRYVEWNQEQAMDWLRANGHEVSVDRLAEAHEVRQHEV